ncbi:DUF1499 domain-containing protein [Accumulibacter sp.]|uniref:DUF1499 domain-containing protein n=1 Tax=Accumulibacter sp. TaxID=2053492 RepID=UPI0028792440|nr:DUF1499 domain-containing protein [Accumulibacter sp.]MDS4050636.1 DUF1499 domain-containing protein [Accumulibacter sp.]
MTRILNRLAIALGVVGALLLAVGQFGLLAGTPPGDLGVRDGRLKAPSTTPNSVSSQARLWPDHPRRDDAYIAPLPAPGDGQAKLARLKAIVEAQSGATVVESRPDYLYAQYRSRLLGFVDDAEFWLDARQGVIHVRSASRLGYHDLQVNRQRIETLRERFVASAD